MATSKHKCFSNRTLVSLFVLLVFLSSIFQVYSAPPPNTEMNRYQYYYPGATVSPIDRRQPIKSIEEKQDDFEEYDIPDNKYPSVKSSYFAPSQLLFTLLRTLSEVLKKVNTKRSNKNIAAKGALQNNTIGRNSTTRQKINKASKLSNATKTDESARAMDPGVVYDDYHHDHHHDEPMTEPPMPMTEAPKQMVKQSRYADPWEGYYEFIITEGSFKFWSWFQLATSALLLYSALAAIYYAKFNPIQPDYDTTYDDYFFGRSLEGSAPMLPADSATPDPGWISGLAGMGRTTFQRIMDAIHTTEDKL